MRNQADFLIGCMIVGEKMYVHAPVIQNQKYINIVKFCKNTLDIIFLGKWTSEVGQDLERWLNNLVVKW